MRRMANPQVTARVSEAFVERIDALGAVLNRQEIHRVLPLERTDVARMALAKGVEVMERELGVKAGSAKPAPARPTTKKRGK